MTHDLSKHLISVSFWSVTVLAYASALGHICLFAYLMQDPGYLLVLGILVAPSIIAIVITVVVAQVWAGRVHRGPAARMRRAVAWMLTGFAPVVSFCSAGQFYGRPNFFEAFMLALASSFLLHAFTGRIVRWAFPVAVCIPTIVLAVAVKTDVLLLVAYSFTASVLGLHALVMLVVDLVGHEKLRHVGRRDSSSASAS